MTTNGITRRESNLKLQRLRDLLMTLAVGAVLGASLGVALNARADSYNEGQLIVLPVNWKLVNVQMQGKKPIALIRKMREDEYPEVWVYKPLETLNANEAELAAEPATVIRESTDRIKKN